MGGWGSLLHPSVWQCKCQQFAVPKHLYLYADTRHHTSEGLFCYCGHIKAWCQWRCPSHPCPIAPILNSKFLCTAATAAKATSHFTVQLPKQSHTVCDSSAWQQVWVQLCIILIDASLHCHCHRFLYFSKAH